MRDCLLIVDFQKEMKIPDRCKMVEKMHHAVEVAKRNKVHCVNLLFVGDSQSLLLKDWKDGIQDGVLQADGSSLLCQADEVISKSGYCMKEADARRLTERYDRIFLAGGYVEACLLAVALQLYSLSERCEIWWMEDLCYSSVNSEGPIATAGKELLNWNLFGKSINMSYLEETSWIM